MVTVSVLTGGEHSLYSVTGAPTAIADLADRFAGKAITNSC
jgi:hypothetical protein